MNITYSPKGTLNQKRCEASIWNKVSLTSCPIWGLPSICVASSLADEDPSTCENVFLVDCILARGLVWSSCRTRTDNRQEFHKEMHRQFLWLMLEGIYCRDVNHAYFIMSANTVKPIQMDKSQRTCQERHIWHQKKKKRKNYNFHKEYETYFFGPLRLLLPIKVMHFLKYIFNEYNLKYRVFI